MISLSAPVFDPIGTFMLKPSKGSNFEETGRRIRKRATLDGGVIVSDAGHSYGDSTWSLVLDNPSKGVADGLARLLRLYQTMTLITELGAFIVVPSKYRFSNNIVTLKLEVIGVA